jgi:hypothetical protein
MPSPLMFLEEKNRQTGIVTEHRSEKGREMNPGLQAAAEELLKAMKGDDAKGVALALENAFYLLESMPHEEAEMEEEE